MKVVAAYLLALLGGNDCPSAEDIKHILGSVGASADDSKISHLLSELDGKDILDVIAEGKEKFASVPSGGAVAVAAAPGDAAPAAAAAPTETAKEAAKEEPEEESDDDMGGLFGDDF